LNTTLHDLNYDESVEMDNGGSNHILVSEQVVQQIRQLQK